MNTETKASNEAKAALYNVEVFNQIFKGGNVDLANTNTAEAHFDEITEKAEEQQAMIDSRIDDMWKDKAVICQAIEESLSDINHVNNASCDVAGDIEKVIDGYLETMVKDELNL